MTGSSGRRHCGTIWMKTTCIYSITYSIVGVPVASTKRQKGVPMFQALNYKIQSIGFAPYIENATLSGCNLGGWGRWVMLCRLATDSLRYEGLGVILPLSNELGVTFLPLDTQGYSVKLGIVRLRNQQPSALVCFCDDVKSVNQGVIDLERVSILLDKCLNTQNTPQRVAFSELRMLSDCRMSCAQK